MLALGRGLAPWLRLPLTPSPADPITSCRGPHFVSLSSRLAALRHPPLAADRYFLVGNCKFVDEILCDAPLVITKELLEDNNIDVVVTATERGEPIVDMYHQAAADAGKLRFLPRTEGLSTTHFIKKIVKGCVRVCVREKEGVGSRW